MITPRRVLWVVSLVALIAVVVGAALMVRNDRAPTDVPNSNGLTADAAADGQCEFLGYKGPADLPACHRGFVTGALVVRGDISPSWSPTTKRAAAYAADVLLSQADAPFRPFGNKEMRSEAWIAGFKKGVLWTGG